MSAKPESDHYHILSEHFQACAELPVEEREKYISGPLIADPALREELRSLFKFHPSAIEVPTPTPLPKSDTRTDTRLRKRGRNSAVLFVLGFGSALIALLLAARAWALGRLEADLRSEALATLMRSVDVQASAIRTWAERQKALAKDILDEPDVIAHAAALAEVAADTKGNKEKLRSSSSFKPLLDRLSQAPPEIGERGFVVITSSGIDVCADLDAIIGRVVTASGASYLRRMVLGERIVSRPYPDRQFALGLEPDYSRVVMFVGGPIHDKEGKLVATGIFRFTPQREFYPLLPKGPARFLAFDEKALLLSDYGDAAALGTYGVAAGIPDAQSPPLRLKLRDPGGDLKSGYRPEGSPDTWVPTMMVRRAVESGRGFSATEYRDALGQTVLGAWTWLPEWDMGLGAEQEVGRILAPMQPVRTVFNLMLAIPVAFTGVLLLMTRPVRSLFGKRSTFGSYILERSVGKGGMAEVFLARHDILKRPAAVKILSNPNPDGAAVARFEREARLACRLGHPNTIMIFDYGETPDGRLYYAMEYVKGLTLAQLMAMEGSLAVGRVLHLLRQIAGALEEAHALGLVHRDLKPSNIMVCSRGGLGDVVKVLDFGIACSSSPAAEDFTRSVEIVGTPAYIAPERIRAPQALDPRSDIYSFGAVGFHLLTGRNVFEGPGPTELIYQVMTAKRPSPSQLRGELLPAGLESLILACIAVEPDARPDSFKAVLATLASVETSERWDQDEAREWWSVNHDKVAAFTKSGGG
ncbi:MAG TPA: serine/threonine-protein kinase [Planctomycetota bacterium]|nr:serine/threonine-protein kinase [Planctomycetota bacterium]